MIRFRHPKNRIQPSAFIVPSAYFTDRSTCLNSFIQALQLFGSPAYLARVIPFEHGGQQLGI